MVHTFGESQLILATAQGNAVRFEESQVRAMGRSARGVIGITLKGDDYVVGAVEVDDTKHLVTVTQKGIGKRTSFDDFRVMKHRGGGGVICQNITEKTGLLAGILTVSEDDDLMMITDAGIIIRTPASDISVLSRIATGVIVMRLDADRYIVNFTKVAKESEKETEETEETAEATEAVEITENPEA